MLAAAQDPDFHPAFAGGNQALKDDRINKFGVLNPQAFLSRINHFGHLATAVKTAPHQTNAEIGIEEAAVPVVLKAIDHLLHRWSRIGDDAVITGLGEVLIREVERGNERRAVIHHDRFLVGHRERFTRPGHSHPPRLQGGIGLIIPAIPA